MLIQTQFTKVLAFVMIAVVALSTSDWTLPHTTVVKDNEPRTYRFTVQYLNANTQGKVFSRQQVIGEYTRGLPGRDVIWKNVAVAESSGLDQPFGPPQKREFMEGFRYHNNSDTMSPDFFKGFPPTAVQERNLVWDEEMFELFGQDQFEHLKLNQPYHLLGNQNIKMPSVGTFENRDVELEWVGRSIRNGKDCAVIEYRAYLNPLNINNGGINMVGRSNYWGQIWVAVKTRQIEYGTLYEDVLGEVKLPGQSAPHVINVFRRGVFEPLSQK